MARHEKVQEVVRREVSRIVLNEIKDPRLGFITVTKVEMTKDLRYAKIFFSVLGGEAEYKKTKEALESASGFIRRLIAQSIQLRFAPEISFREDKSTQYSIRIQEVLDQIKELDEPKKRSRKHKEE